MKRKINQKELGFLTKSLSDLSNDGKVRKVQATRSQHPLSYVVHCEEMSFKIAQRVKTNDGQYGNVFAITTKEGMHYPDGTVSVDGQVSYAVEFTYGGKGTWYPENLLSPVAQRFPPL